MAKFILSAFADEISPVFDEQLESLKKLGINMIELRGVDGKSFTELTDNEVDAVKEKLDNAGITLSSLGSPIGKIKVDGDMDAHKALFTRIMNIGDKLSCKRVRMFSFYPAENMDRKCFGEKVFELISQLLEMAEERGFALCHENEKGIFGDDIDGCLKILQHFDKIKMVFDPANFIQCGVDTLEAWEKLHKYVDYMHIKDALEDKRVVRAGYGIGNIEKLIKMYQAQGGEVLTLEPHLAVFAGLKQLENGESIKDEHTYPDNNTAFDAGAKALFDILDRI